MVAETIVGGLGGLKTAIEMVKGLGSTITDVAIAEAKNEIIGHLAEANMALLDASRTLLEDTDTIRALEAEIAQLKNWDADAKRYELADVGQGSLAYRLRDEQQGVEPPHSLCPNCFASRTKSILQPRTIPEGRARILWCPACGTELTVHGVRLDKVAPMRRGR